VTLPEAHDTARNGAERFGNKWVVFRLAAWPPAVYSASAKTPLPDEAHIVAIYPKPPSGPKITPAAAPRDDPQGSLF
jgi:hypothetical protein